MSEDVEFTVQLEGLSTDVICNVDSWNEAYDIYIRRNGTAWQPLAKMGPSFQRQVQVVIDNYLRYDWEKPKPADPREEPEWREDR